MSDDLGSNSPRQRRRDQPDERIDSRRESLLPEGVNPEEIKTTDNNSEDINLENYSIPGYVVEEEPIAEDWLANQSSAKPVAGAPAKGFYPSRPALGRGFDANTYRPLTPSIHSSSDAYPASRPAFSPSASSPSATSSTTGVSQSSLAEKKSKGLKSKGLWFLPKRSAAETVPVPGIDPATGLETVGVLPPVVIAPKLWEKQPYRAIAHISAIAGTLTAAWLFGILAARMVPGSPKHPPLQESVLRKSSRLASGLWHLPQLWQTPMAETRIEAIPLPETGPILEPVELPPLERQPLIDELNTVETELLTLDRRLQTLERRLGKPPYQNADVESRINALRGAIDPPVRTEAAPQYKPSPRDPQAALLAVADRKITLPSDALFAPGDNHLKDSELLNQVLDQLINYPEATIVIRSYSDDQVAAIATRKYTLAQAIRLSAYLSASLPEGYRWVTIGGGQSQPIAPNDSATNRQRNRRIEILVDTR